MPRCLFYLLFLVISSSLFALPQHPQVIEGMVSISGDARQMTISTSQNRSIVHWDSFSIGANESACFELPHAQAAILNRVIGSDVTHIMGDLFSNGAVYLINPQGVIIGKEGVIYAASFLASTLDVANRDFLEGKDLHFSGDSNATIENWGWINLEGDAIFLAQTVKNAGRIDCIHGVIALGAGKEMLFLPYGDERIQILLHPEQEKNIDLQGVHQLGILRASSAELKGDGNLYGYAIKNEGIVEATGFETGDGHIYFVAEKGVAHHSGSLKGDEIYILGDHVRILGEARIDASRSVGGGTILIGGDFQGNNPTIPNANSTFVDKEVIISANALDKGNGGKVIVWADGANGFYGKINVCGGPSGGNGGFVEISGKNALDFQGLVNAEAPLGKNGDLLLDPANITISTGANANITFVSCPTGTYDVTANNAVINTTDLEMNLASGCNITISTAAAGTQAGTITVSSPFSWTSDNFLTMNANAGITVNAAISNTSPAASLTLNSGTTTSSVLTIGTTGSITMTGMGASSTGALNLNSNAISTSDMTISGAISVTDKDLNINVADVFTLSPTTGSIHFSAPGKTFTFSKTGASLTNFNGNLNLNGTTVITAGGTINFNNGTTASTFTTSGTGTTMITAAGNVVFGSQLTATYMSTGAFSVAATNAGSDITISCPFSFPMGAPNVTFSPADNFVLTATTGSISYAGAGSTLSLTAGGTTAHLLNGSITITEGNFSAVADDAVTIAATTGSLTYDVPGGTCTLICTAGNININGTLTINNGTLHATAFDNLMVDDGATFTHASTATSTLSTIGTDGDIMIDGTMNVTEGSITMTATGITGSITQNAASGSITWSSPGTLTMNATDITLSGISTFSNGNTMLTATDACIFATTSEVNWNSPGTMTIFTTTNASSNVSLNGTIMTFTNGSLAIDAMGSITTGGSSTINYSSLGTLSMISRQGAIDLNAAINLNTAALFSLSALVGDISINGLITNISTGNIHVVATSDVIIGGAAQTTPSQLSTTGGIIQIDAGSLIVQGSAGSPGATATLGPAVHITADVNGAISVLGLGTADATIQSTGPLTLTASDNFSMQGSALVTANGNLTVRANNIILTRDAAPLIRMETFQGNIQLIANHNFTATDARVTNFGSGALKIVVDQQAPFPSDVGNGQFNLLGNSTLQTTGGELQIFTALPAQNQVEGLINGATLEQGEQVFGIWFSTFSGPDPFPFTIFYKQPSGTASFINLGVASTQMTQHMFDRTLGWAWMSPYLICYSPLYSARERWLFKRKAFEYPIIFSRFTCPYAVPEKTINDPYRIQF